MRLVISAGRSRPYPKDLTRQQQAIGSSTQTRPALLGSTYEQMRELFQSQTHPQTIQDNLSGGDLLPEPSPSNELCVLLQSLSDWV